MEKDNRFIVYIEKSIIRNWDRDALTDHDTGTTLQFKDVARKIAKFHIIFESAGIKPGDKIALFLATMTYGAVIVPIHHELKADNIHNIVNHSEAKMLFIYDKLWPQLNIDEMPDLILVATLSDFNLAACRNDKVKDALENRNAIYGKRYPKSFRSKDVNYRKEESPEELAIINYTSGTTGFSKGVMLPYRSIWSNVEYCREMLPVKAGDNIISMLPLGHVFGMTYDFLFGFTTGAHLHFLTKIPSPNIIAETFPKIRPRVISCVPLVIEKAIKKSILPRIDSKIGRLLLHIPIINEKIKKSALHEAKEIFGGTGMNIWNPALLARAFVFFAYPSKISGDTIWIEGLSAADKSQLVDGFSGATPLAQLANGAGANELMTTTSEPLNFMQMFIGNIPGAIGETSTIAILIGAVILIWTGVASWKIMLSCVAGAVAIGLIVPDNIPVWYHLVMGGFAFGAIFMATDPVTSAQTECGKWIYGFLIGAMTIVIRVFNPGYPEGMMLAILLMNTFAPLIDYFVINSNIKKRAKRVAA